MSQWTPGPRSPGWRGQGPGQPGTSATCLERGEEAHKLGIMIDCYPAVSGTSSSTRCCEGWSRRCRTPRWGPAAVRTATPGSASPCCCTWQHPLNVENYNVVILRNAHVWCKLSFLTVRHRPWSSGPPASQIIISAYSTVYSDDDDDHLGAAELVCLGAAAEHVWYLLSLRAVEALVPPTVRVHKPRAVRGAENN